MLRPYLFLVLLLSSALVVRAQPVKDTFGYAIKHFIDDDGLPQNSVKSIIAGNSGFIWMTTENGLVRYNGNDFTVFDKSKLKGITSNRFSAIRKGADGFIYAVNDNHEIIQIHKGRVKTDSSINSKNIELAGNKTNRLTVNENDAQSKGLRSYLIDGLPARVRYTPASMVSYRIPEVNGASYTCYKDSVILSGKDYNIVIPFKADNLIRFFSLDHELYFLNPGGEFTRFNKLGKESVVVTGDLLKDPTYSLHKDQLTFFWNTAADGILLYFNKAFYTIQRTLAATCETKLAVSGFDIANKQIISHYFDKKYQRLFLGSEVKGLYIIEKKQFTVFSENDSDRNNVYYAQVPFDSNRILTSRGSILGFNDTGKYIIPYKKRRLVDRYSMLVDKKGFIWIKQWSELLKFDHDMNLVSTLSFPYPISTIYQTEDGLIWMGFKGKGLFYLDANKENTLATKFNDLNDITYISGSGHSNLWIGTAKGLYKIERISNKTIALKQLGGKFIRSLYQAGSDELWITTYEDGLFLYQNDRLAKIPNDRDNYLSTAHCIVPDKKGFFWITTNKGLFQASRADMIAYTRKEQNYIYYHYYSKDKGFQTNEFNGGCQPCGAAMDNGFISLPSLDGMVWFDPLSLKLELPEYPLFIEKMEVDKQLVSLSDSIQLPHKFNQFKILLGTVYFGNKRNLQTSYSLVPEGSSESAWYPVPIDNVISFSTLLSGNYKLHIRKINGFGKNNYDETVIRIIVPQAFYETLMFKILILLGIIGLIYLYFRLRILFVLKNNRLLELQIARRTRKLQHTLRVLETSESTLRRQTQIHEMLIAAISHDIKSPMKYLLLASQKMRQFISKKQYDSLPVINEAIQDTASKVYYILENLLKYISIQLRKGEVKFVQFDLYKIIAEKVSLFTDIAQGQKTVIINDVPENTFVFSNMELLAVVIHNLLDNSVKYTAKGRIRISVLKEKKLLHLVIQDSGTGIDYDLASWLNNKEDHIEIDTASGHKGMGLIIVKELLSAIDSKITAGVSESGGTKIQIALDTEPRQEL